LQTRGLRRDPNQLGKIACGDFAGHHFVDRRQKAWFLPATPQFTPDITPSGAGKKPGF